MPSPKPTATRGKLKNASTAPVPKPTAKSPPKVVAKGAAALAPKATPQKLVPKMSLEQSTALTRSLQVRGQPKTSGELIRENVTGAMSLDNAFRQTGRTARMLETAAETARKGTPVLIIMKDEARADHVLNTAKFYANTQVNVRSHNPKLPLFDWATLETTAPEYKGWKVFVDHDVAFVYHRHILNLLGWTNNTASNEGAA